MRCIWCSNPTTQKFGPELLHHSAKCFSCGYCYINCPENAVKLAFKLKEEGGVSVDRLRCSNCGECLGGCKGKAMQLAGKEWSIGEVTAELLKDMNYYRNSGGGVTLSGGEVLSQAGFALELCASLKNYGVHLAMETSGFGRLEDLLALGRAVDFIFFDVKHLDSARHDELTAQDNNLFWKILQLWRPKCPKKSPCACLWCPAATTSRNI